MNKIHRLYFRILRFLGSVSATTFLVLAAFQSCAMAEEPQNPNCVLANDRPAQVVAGEIGLNAGAIDELQEVFEKIASAARLRPALFVCQSGEFDAFAMELPDGKNRLVCVTTGLLARVRSDKNILARFIGHEIAHLLLRHSRKKAFNEQDAAADAYNDVSFISQRRSLNDIDKEAISYAFVNRVREFSRAMELEADEVGFLFASKAGFGLNSAEKISSMFRALGDNSVARYFDSHPGYLERQHLGSFLEKNEALVRQARNFVTAKKMPLLEKHVNQWINVLPESGAAYFYQGLWMISAKKHPAQITEAFEDSWARFERPSVGKIAQSIQGEALAAPLQLGIALYLEGEKLRSLSSTANLSNEDLNRFRQQTGWKSQLVVSVEQQAAPSFWHAVNAEGNIVISNLDSHKEERWMKPVRAWNAPRLPKELRNTVVKQVVEPEPRKIFSNIVDAARYGNEVDIYESLVAGSDANAQVSGITPLGAAVMAGNVANVQYLILAGANPNARDGFRYTAFDYALRTGRSDIVNAMRDGNETINSRGRPRPATSVAGLFAH